MLSKFHTRPIAKAIWIVISQLWVSLTKITVRPFLWVFLREINLNSLILEMVFMECPNKDVDGLYGMPQQICRLKGKLIFGILAMELCESLSLRELHLLCQLVLQHLRGFRLP